MSIVLTLLNATDNGAISLATINGNWGTIQTAINSISGGVSSVNVSGGTTGLTTSGGPITTAGTITFAGTLNETHGGTNQTTYAIGDILYASNANTLSKQAIGTNGQILTVVGGVPAWSSLSSPGITRQIISISSNTTLASASLTDYVYNVTGNTTATLPTAIGNTNRYTVKNQGSGNVTINTLVGGQTIDGVSSVTLTASLSGSYDFESDNANWNIV